MTTLTPGRAAKLADDLYQALDRLREQTGDSLNAVAETALTGIGHELQAIAGSRPAIDPDRTRDRRLIALWSMLDARRADLITPENVDEHLARALAHNPHEINAQALRGAANRIRSERAAV